MRKYLSIFMLLACIGSHALAFGTHQPKAVRKHVQKPKTHHKNKDSSSSSSHHHHRHEVQLKSAYPWEYVVDNTKTFKFVVMNFFTDLFDPSVVADISKNVEEYVAKAVFPSWRYKICVQFFIPPSQEQLAADALNSAYFINAVPQPGTFIPIVLTNNFSENIPDDFGAAVHGNVSGSPTTGYNASLYLDNDFLTFTGPFPFGTPFIVIPAGSSESGNGINGLIAANSESGQGPTEFYQALSLVMSQEIISLLIDPSASRYVASGNPLGNPAGGPLPDGTSGVLTSQSFYQVDATAPFLHGDKNVVKYHGWSMGNFALPAYFMPYDSSGCYDFCGNTNAPLTPYEGSQFVIYQDFFATDYPDGVLTDLLVGNYISSLDDPSDITLVSGGSIYEYEGWGMESSQGSMVVRNALTANGRNRNAKHVKKALAKAKHKKKCTNCKPSSKPRLLPFEYIDNDGFLTSRFAIINYIPDVLDPVQVDATIPVLEKYIAEQYLPYWNIKAKIKNYTVYPGDIGLPEFDGTFIPFFFLNLDQFDLTKLGANAIPGGAVNINNVPDFIVGPLISEWLKATPEFSVPDLPLANPYLIVSEANFPGQVTVTTDQPGLGPFTAIPTGSSTLIPTTFPIVALGENADPLDGCSTLVNDLTGKIGVNLRDACDSTVYPNNMADAGAIAFLTVFDGGAQLFAATGAEIWGATMGPDGQALIDALAVNPDITITISAPETSRTDYNTFSVTCSHEIEELLVDANYATYCLTFNPFVDRAVLFSQLEAADPDETLDVIATRHGSSYGVEGFPLPSYFVAYLRTNNYDSVGIIWRALVPESRQQMLFHFESDPEAPFNPIHSGYVFGPVENGFSPDLVLQDFGSIFDPHNSSGYPPTEPSVKTPVADTPLDTIYDALENLRDVLFI